MTVTIVIPAHNEDSTIFTVVSGCIPYGEVIVVDDGSTDHTAVEALRAGASHIIELGGNHGYSYALRQGYKAADGDIVAIVDADGQQSPSELGLLLNPILKNQADMVIGSKILGSIEYKPVRKNASMNWLWTKILRARFGIRLTHPFSGFRAMRKNCIDMNDLKGNRFENVLELDISFAKHHYRIIEVPRVAKARVTGTSHVRPIDGLRVMWRGIEMIL